ncbi:histone [candidate division MSBL1 archaeon SCGC-AAA259J03]|uniref:Histone n=1 Tax=candidate division MSBL1 archaeon SCGC-AAA259J03 TaxID=1698269 RepID=A0A656YWZ7_9EURY|nr:histone [candidate division MSBL1 archaeon SCGC-AAA259J03]
MAAVNRIIRRSGGQRDSESAAEELAEVFEEKSLEIVSEVTTMAEHAGRKTVRDEDVRLAVRE